MEVQIDQYGNKIFILIFLIAYFIECVTTLTGLGEKNVCNAALAIK